MIKPFATKWNLGFGYGGDSLYGFQKHYWTIGWHRSDLGWKFNFGRIV